MAESSNNSSKCPTTRETPLATVWPSIAAMPAGRWVGKMCGIRAGIGGFLTVGKLMALATIPVSLVAYFWKVMPGICRRYILTNRRVVIQKGLKPADESSIALDAFDDIRIETLPGEEWLRAGEMVFVREGQEVFRLAAVPHPEVFRQLCLKTRTALISVRETIQQQTATSAA